jgi:YD repeat-containing protein
VYDGDGKQVSATDANGNATTTAYTLDELVASVTGQPSGSITHLTQYGYDANGNQTSVTDPMSNVSSTAYYADNLRQYTQDGAGDRTTYTYDNVGNPTQVLSPSGYAKDASNLGGTPTINAYTQDNLLLSTTVPVSTTGASIFSRKTIYSYDDGSRKASQDVQLVNGQGGLIGDGGTQSFTYYSDDRLQTQIGRSGETITTLYDAAGNQTSIHDSTSNTTIVGTYYADDLSRSVDDGSRTTKSLYDGLGAPAAEVQLIDGGSTQYATTYVWGDAELPSSMSSAAVQAGSTTFTYDAGGRSATQTDPNGETSTWSYNPDNTLASRLLATSGHTTLASWSYQYNNDYLQTQQSFSGGAASPGSVVSATFSFTYDAANRLKTWSNGSMSTTYTWNHDGDRTQVAGVTTVNYGYNADDDIGSSSLPNTNYAYFYFGGLASDGCFNYYYDGFDRLSSATPTSSPPAGCSASSSASYAYDGLDRQIRNSATNIHYQGLTTSVAMETSSAGTNTVYELDASGQPKGLTNESSSPTTQYLSDDGTQSISTVTATSQALACTLRYDPFGAPLSPQSASNPCSSGSTYGDLFFEATRQDPTTGDYQSGPACTIRRRVPS